MKELKEFIKLALSLNFEVKYYIDQLNGIFNCEIKSKNDSIKFNFDYYEYDFSIKIRKEFILNITKLYLNCQENYKHLKQAELF